MSKRKENEMSGSEESEEEVILEEEKKIAFATILHKILQSQLPLSETHPGYLLGFVNMLEAEENLPSELENSLRGFQKAAKTWSFNTGKASKKGVIEYLESCKGLMGNLFEMSFGSKMLESVKTFLSAYKEMDITEEDCSRYVEKIHTSMSSMTASSATGRVGATGGKRRKLMEPMLDEIDVHIDEIPVEVEPSPTFKTYSSIIARKDGQQYIRKYEEKWKEFQARVTIYRRADLMDCPKSSEKWKYKYQELELNYNSGDPLSMMTNRIKGHLSQYLEEKNVSWERKKEYKFE
ncbi:NS2 [uncultured densovirus]|uniref:NS2 n=1 Tax=Asterias forbesi-associated densovirus TaxID=3071312 RepID=A0A6B9R1L9_9VIRU|nr:NS2 [uncultured densovirus]QHG62570.1 NS2 [Asterias forbesi-associated densovirus]